MVAFQLTIKHWHAVAEWTWSQGDDDVCGICRQVPAQLTRGRKPRSLPEHVIN